MVFINTKAAPKPASRVQSLRVPGNESRLSAFQGLRQASSIRAMKPTRYHAAYTASNWVNATLATPVAV